MCLGVACSFCSQATCVMWLPIGWAARGASDTTTTTVGVTAGDQHTTHTHIVYRDDGALVLLLLSSLLFAWAAAEASKCNATVHIVWRLLRLSTACHPENTSTTNAHKACAQSEPRATFITAMKLRTHHTRRPGASDVFVMFCRRS